MLQRSMWTYKHENIHKEDDLSDHADKYNQVLPAMSWCVSGKSVPHYVQ